jgi:carboxypeptidase C (cathepsin A)
MTQSGVTLNGLVLANGGLSFSSRDPFYDHDYEMMLPSYAAAAWYHNKLPTRPSDLAAFLAEVETYARGPYLQALAHGMEISDTQKHEVAARLSAYTGLDQEFLLRHNLRVDFVEFRKELLRKEGKSIGQLDTRVTAFAEDVGGETLDGDAATERYAPAFTALARDYLINTLKYQTNLEYLLSNGEAIQAHWDWMRRDSYPDLPWIARNLNEDLEQGVRLNPTMRVLFLESYFDLAGVFFSAADDVAHMQIDPALRGNLKMKFYEAGHAIFTEDAIQAQLRADMDELLDATL